MNTMDNSEWNKIENMLAAVTKNKAGKFANFGGVQYGYDDAFQEGRMALLLAMPSYDEKKGALHSFAATVLENNYRTIMTKLNTKSRRATTVPIVALSDECSGSTEDVVTNDKLCEQELIDLNFDLEQEVLEKELEALLVEFKTDLRQRLPEFPAKVFDCRVCPCLKMLINRYSEPTIVELMEFFGVSKNRLDYALHVIRGELTTLARNKKYIDLFGDKVTTLQWPQILHSTKAYDNGLVGEAVERWGLKTVPIGIAEERKEDAWRCLEEYDWGTVIYWGDGRTKHTVVAIGRFNATSGELFGKTGTRESIPYLAKYCDVVKILKGGDNA